MNRSYVLLTEFSPLIVARRTGALVAEQAHELLDEFDRAIQSADEKIAFVYDAGNSSIGAPDAVGRQVVGGWFRDHAEMLAEHCLACEFSVPNAVSRGVITAIFWIGEPTVPVGVHQSPLAAITSAIHRLGREHDIDPAHVLEVLERRSRRSA